MKRVVRLLSLAIAGALIFALGLTMGSRPKPPPSVAEQTVKDCQSAMWDADSLLGYYADALSGSEQLGSKFNVQKAMTPIYSWSSEYLAERGWCDQEAPK